MLLIIFNYDLIFGANEALIEYLRVGDRSN
jgi:hypothetical protein